MVDCLVGFVSFLSSSLSSLSTVHHLVLLAARLRSSFRHTFFDRLISARLYRSRHSVWLSSSPSFVTKPPRQWKPYGGWSSGIILLQTSENSITVFLAFGPSPISQAVKPAPRSAASSSYWISSSVSRPVWKCSFRYWSARATSANQSGKFYS